MGDLINLNRARKARAMAEKRTAAEVNRVAHGRTRAERAVADQEREAARRRLDAHSLGKD